MNEIFKFKFTSLKYCHVRISFVFTCMEILNVIDFLKSLFSEPLFPGLKNIKLIYVFHEYAGLFYFIFYFSTTRH